MGSSPLLRDFGGSGKEEADVTEVGNRVQASARGTPSGKWHKSEEVEKPAQPSGGETGPSGRGDWWL